MARHAFDFFKPKLEDSAYNLKRPLSVSLGPRSATPGSRFFSGPGGTAKTTNKVPGVVKVEDDEVPNKDPTGFQTRAACSVVGSTTTPTVVKQKAMPTKRGDTPIEVSGPTQASSSNRSNRGPSVVDCQVPSVSGPRQPPTPSPSSVVEAPESADDQAKRHD